MRNEEVHERPAALHAGFVRAHARPRGPHAERRFNVLAGNVDSHHKVAVADPILCQRSVRETVTRLTREINPELIGLP